MFDKKNDNTVPAQPGGDTRATSILAQGCNFKGEVEIKGTFRVEGQFEGSIRNPETLVIGRTGVVKGDISVKNAIVGGRVFGNIVAEDRIELQSGSQIEGDIRTRRLVIDEGVVFEGNCSMGKQTDPKETKQPNQPNQPKDNRKSMAATSPGS